MPNPPFPENQPYPWATAVVPKRPRGWYSPIYRAMEAYNGFAVYPAFYGQFFGPYVRRDYWWAGEAAEQFPHIANGMPWGFQGHSSIWDTFANLYLNLHGAGFFSYPWYWDRLFVVMFDDSLPQKWALWEASIQAPNRVKNQATGVSYPFGSEPIHNQLVPDGGYFLAANVVTGTSFPRDPDVG